MIGSRAKIRGFTLIEILIALAIFVIMSAISFRGLNGILESRARIVDDNRKWRDVAMAFAMIERDIDAAANRSARSVDDLVLPPFIGNAPEWSRQNSLLEFSRMGDSGVPSRRVAYRLNGTTLELLAFPSIDAAPRDEPTAYPLLYGVQAVSTRFMDSNGAWLERWPVASNLKREPPLPRAVALSLTLTSGEEMNRIFALP